MNFRTTPQDMDLIVQIAQRAADMAEATGVDYPKHVAVMDLAACHVNGCPLALALMLTADDSNFAHDAFGIRRHIDRTTGELGDCFMPRFAACNHDGEPAPA